jgi:hypothetical protein
MDGISLLLFAALVQGAPVSAPTPLLDFYFTNDEVLERGAAAATAQWTAQCVLAASSPTSPEATRSIRG